MTSYPAAFYVNVFDGVAGTLEFNSTPGSHAYNPVDGGTISDGRTVTMSYGSGPGAVLSISSAYPGTVAAGWATTAVAEWTFDDNTNRLSLAVKGALPAMTTGVIPSGWVLREHSWEVEATGGSLVVPYSFSDANDVGDSNGIPLNQTPVYLVPYFGNYGTGAGVGDPIFSVVGGNVSADGVGDAWVTLTFPKPLNPNQTLAVMNISITSAAGGSALALPQSVVNGITVGQTLNSYNQITALVFRVPLSSVGLGVIKPGYSYNFPITITQSLTFLSGDSYGTSNVVIATGSTAIQIAAVTQGPTLSNAELSVVSGSGMRYASSYWNSDIFGGSVRLTYTATDPWGVNSNSTILMLKDAGAIPPYGYFYHKASTNAGATSGTFTTDFSIQADTQPSMGGGEGGSTPYVLKYATPVFAASTRTFTTSDSNPNGALTSSASVSAQNPLSAGSTVGYASINCCVTGDASQWATDTQGVYFFDYNGTVLTNQGSGGDYIVVAGLYGIKIKLPVPPAFVASVSVTFTHGTGSYTWTRSNGGDWNVLTPGGAGHGYPARSSTDFNEVNVRNQEDHLVLYFYLDPLSYSDCLSKSAPGYNVVSYTITDVLGNTSVQFARGFYVTSFDANWSTYDGGCVPYTAQIQMADGALRSAGEIKPGDVIATFNPLTGEIGPNPVLHVVPRGVQPCVQIKTDDGRSFVCSTTHRIAVAGEGYYEAADVQVGHTLVTYTSCPAVVSSVESVDAQEVVTFTIDDATSRNYFADGVLAHNKVINDCVPAGTPVAMADGTLARIEKVRPGDMVRAFDNSTLTHTERPVLETFITVAHTLYQVEVEGGECLEATATHVLMTGKGWMTIQALIDDEQRPKVFMEDGTYRSIRSITKTEVPEGVKVYLLEVAGDHTLFVNHFASHNVKNRTP